MYTVKIDEKQIKVVNQKQKLSDLSQLTVGQFYRVESDTNVIPENGVSKLKSLLRTVSLREPEWFKLIPKKKDENGKETDEPIYDPWNWNEGRRQYLPDFPEDWAWVNTVDNKHPTAKKYGTGKFAKRYSKFVYDTIGINLPPKFLEELGKMAAQFSDKKANYNIFEVVKDFEWKAGDFGDGGSCFWGGRNEARRILRRNGAVAFRFYQYDFDANLYKGAGRCWAVLNKPNKNQLIIFNGYGSSLSGDALKFISRVISDSIEGFEVVMISLKNDGSDSGTLYVNGGRGFVIGQNVRNIEKYDFKWRETYIGECCTCGQGLYENVDGDDQQHYSVNNRRYCQECYEEQIIRDDVTDEEFDPQYDGQHEIQIYVHGEWVDATVCDRTYQTQVLTCYECGRRTTSENTQIVLTESRILCRDCFSANAGTCDGCKTTHLSDNLQESDGEVLCQVCISDRQ